MAKETIYDHIHDAQRHFRILLDATARPGSIHRLHDVSITPPESLYRASALIGFSLLNGDVSFYMDEKNQEAVDYMKVNTSSSYTCASEADFIFINGKGAILTVQEAGIGDPQYPEGGATIIIEADKISEKALSESIHLSLSGPGIPGEKSMYVRGIKPDVIEEIIEKNQEFPMGVDTFITDKNDSFFCIPRSTSIKWSETHRK